MNKQNLLFLCTTLLIFSGCKLSNSASSTKPATAVPTPVATTGPDPLLPYQWHLDNTGQGAFSTGSGTSGADINVDNLFDQGINGAGIVVAVSDTNIEVTHEDLAANVSIPYSRNYLGSTTASWPGVAPTTASNTSSHGTSVMGLIGAAANNAVGGRGVAPSATLAGFNFIESSQSLSRKLDQAAGNSIDIFNYSYGTDTCSVVTVDSSYVTQLKNGVTSQRSGKGSLYVKAAGNEYYGNVGYCNPAYEGYTYLGNSNMEQTTTYPYMILAAALTSTAKLTEYSTPGSNLWISAPGGENGITAPGIISTDLMGCSKGYSKTGATNTNAFDKGQNSLNTNCNYTSTLEGTSFASPITAGTIALILQANPALTWRDVKHILAATAVKIDPTALHSNHPLGDDLSGSVFEYGWTQNAAGYWFSNWYGFGEINAKAAVQMAQTYSVNLKTLSEAPFSSGTISVTIPDDSSTGATSSINVSSNLIAESIQVTVSITHPFASELGIELTSPSGTTSRLLYYNSGLVSANLTNVQFLSNAFYGESVTGNWTIKVVDALATDTGTLTSWKVNVFGHAP